MGTAAEHWRVRITGPAEADLRSIIRFSRDQFGANQAAVYRQTILSALAELPTGLTWPAAGRVTHFSQHCGASTSHDIREEVVTSYFIAAWGRA